MITMIVLLFYYIHNGLVHLCGENSEIWDFPGSLVVKNPPSNAGTQIQSLVWEDPPRQQSNWAYMPQLLKPRLPRAGAPTSEATATSSPQAAMKTQCSQKKKKKNQTIFLKFRDMYKFNVLVMLT